MELCARHGRGGTAFKVGMEEENRLRAGAEQVCGGEGGRVPLRTGGSVKGPAMSMFLL